jgi:hypothetical protein
MAETLNFREAVQRAGVSRQRVNEAIRSGRLPATRGGGPGKPTTIRLEDLQAWCQSEGLAMPVDATERLERSQPPALAEMMGRLEQMFAGFERLERSQTQEIVQAGTQLSTAILPESTASPSDRQEPPVIGKGSQPIFAMQRTSRKNPISRLPMH